MATLPKLETQPPGQTATSRHYSPAEVAELWGISVDTVRRLFQKEPGVLVIEHPTKYRKRGYSTLRIPQSVLDRVHLRMTRV